MICGSSWRL